MIPRYSRPAMSRVWSEDNQFALWLKVEIAASQAWTEQGVIPADDMAEIKKAIFSRALYDEHFEQTKHDVVSFTRAVTPSIGDAGRWIHYGLTSNDVKDTALSLQLVEAVDLIDGEVQRLMEAVKARAEENIGVICIGRSHGIHAEPMSFGLKLALWYSELADHRKSIALARESVSVGKISGPVGTYAGIPPQIEESVCRQLGIAPAPVSSQIVPRHRHANFVSALAQLAASLEKFATEIRALQRTEIREVEEPFGTPGFVSTGSSSMPHKRNPELTERICGLARVVRGNSVVALENVALWHERDISHSSAERIILPDSSLAIDYMLDLLTGVVSGMKIYTGRMMENVELTRGLVFSSRVLAALIESGMDRTSAYEIVQAAAMQTWDARDENSDFRELIKADRKVAQSLNPTQLDELFDYNFFITHVAHTFERLGLSTAGLKNA
ncbi:MAG: adenylosuccinate lyase [Proteobacteria bacterium]|nr:adenylosuccinate lyase [Pseudomonadota bacterium]